MFKIIVLTICMFNIANANANENTLNQFNTEVKKTLETVDEKMTEEDLMEVLNINKIIQQKKDADMLKKQQYLEKEKQVIQVLKNLSPKNKEREMFAVYEKFSQSCQDFIHNSFLNGKIDLKSQTPFYKQKNASLCVFYGFNLAQIFADDITFNINIGCYQHLPGFTKVLIGMNSVHRKLIKTTEKYKNIMITRGYLEK